MYSLDDDLFRRARRVRDLSDAGLTARDLDGPLWTSPFRGVRIWSGLGRSDPQVAISAAAALLPHGCAVGGWAAAYNRGIGYLDGDVEFTRQAPVLLLITPGHQLRHRPGIRPVRTRLDPTDVELVDGIPTAVLDLAALQQMCLAPGLVEAVVVADMVTSSRTGQPTIPLHILAARIRSVKKVRGIRQARTALELCSARSASPMESRTRMVWVLDAGLPRPEVNCPVFSLSGQLLGYADLLDEEAGVVHEIDGGQHQELGQRTADNPREERFEAHGLTVSRSTALDLAHRSTLARRMRETRRRGLARERSKDRWTLTPPPWWQDRAA